MVRGKMAIIHRSPSLQLVCVCVCVYVLMCTQWGTPLSGVILTFTSDENCRCTEKKKKIKSPADISFSCCYLYLHLTLDAASCYLFLVINCKRKSINFLERKIFWMQLEGSLKRWHTRVSHHIEEKPLAFAVTAFNCPGKIDGLFSQAILPCAEIGLC